MSTKPESREPRRPAAAQPEPTASPRQALRRRGVVGPLGERLAAALEARWTVADPAERAALLEGAVLAARVSESTAAPPADRVSSDRDLETDVREAERMLEAFATELGKMDEVLEVLAATVRRMRSVSAPESETLH